MAVLKVPVSASDHIQGSEDAVFTLVEYGDYECPYCQSANGVVKQVQKHLGAKLRYVFRHFPMSQVHPYAEAAAEAAEFAGSQGRFWDMHELIYARTGPLDIPYLIQITEQLGLSVEDLEAALENKTYDTKIRADFMSGVRSGVNGTPTFFINDQRYNGSFEQLLTAFSP